MISRYVSRVENLPVLRGKLLLAQHLRANVANQARIYCEYDELVVDNTFNQVIKFILRLLLEIARSGFTKRMLTELLYRFEAVTDRPIELIDLKRLSFDRNNSRYKGIFEFCEWILRGLSPDVASGKHRSLALLFDMNRLFEAFVAHRLKPIAWKNGYRLREQGPQKRLLRRIEDDLELAVLKPDITLTDSEGAIAAILDAKWKILDPNANKFGLSSADLYQVTSYALRYGCDRVGLIYPATANLLDQIEFAIPDTSIRLTLYFVDLPQSAGAKDWPGWTEIVADGSAA
jgi:5-methylcytosine-specific restriction enzyme subunit McrC